MMLCLEEDRPWLYKQYKEHGYHCVRRSDKYWAGLWTDLVIEQTMMRSIKSIGGLTRGRGMDEALRTVWVSTLHACGEVEQTMRTLTNTIREQHVELRRSRRNRDLSDLLSLCRWLDQFDPFETGDARLRSLSTGLAASENDEINCDEAESIGQSIQRSLVL